MTIGIYRLVFEGTSKCYIGQSINIEQRYSAHLNSFYSGKANPKMLKAFEIYGSPTLEILCECLEKELDKYEAEAIEIFDSVNNGFNIFSSAADTPISYGETHSRCKYSNEQLLTVATLLTNPNNKGKDIAEKTGVSLTTVQDISSLKCHGWISSVDPELYTKLKELKSTRKNPKTAAARGIHYPAVVSPEGVVYRNIDNLKVFCEQHNLYRSNFRKMMQGKNKSCAGWVLYKDG